METQEENSHFEDWAGDGSFPLIMRGLQLAHKLQAELHDPPSLYLEEANKTCFTQHVLGRLRDIVGSLNDGIHKLSSPLLQLPQEINDPPKHPSRQHPRKSRQSPSIAKGQLQHSPRRKLKRCLAKSRVELQGVKEGFYDSFTWLKYGQKPILGKTHPRSYYRCFHSRGLNCPALKQVQQCDGITSSFNITYIDKHTCKGICEGLHETENDAAARLPSANSHSSLASVQEVVNISNGPENSLDIYEIEEAGAGVQDCTKSMLYSMLEREMAPPPLQVSTFLEETADSYGFSQAEEQSEESHHHSPSWDFETFLAFTDVEGFGTLLFNS